MKKFERIIREVVPTMVVFQHAGNQDAVEVKYLIADLKEKFGNRANIERVDSSYDGDLKMKYKLAEYPTWILFKEGQELMRESGRKTAGQLEDMLRRAI